MMREALWHPKMVDLAERLGRPHYVAVGIVEMLIHNTALYAIQGDIGKYDNARIAKMLEWDGDPDALIDALIGAGWVDQCDVHRLLTHDWAQHADRHTKKKASSRGLEMITGPVRGEQSESRPAKSGRKTRKVRRTDTQSQDPDFADQDSGSESHVRPPGPVPVPGPGAGLSAAAAATAEREPDPPAGEPERPAPKPKPEPRPNPVWDAIAARWFPSGITPREESRVGALARDFATKIGDADPARAIEAHVEAHRRKFPNVQVVTPESVLKHWDALIPPKRAGPAAAAGTWRDLPPRAQRAVHDALLAERPDLRGIGFLDDRLTVEYVRFVRERGVPTPEGAGA